ncbi:DUF4129 domain-containing transglutaminase family protein [Evansella sp. AB-rgal1]|uniref:DUF4129 domain-containing transglutaminase family protein n=1 Tax=Evansella sp. AB-rgal1 TaxID=3242696 RepID=UPI00359E38A5
MKQMMDKNSITHLFIYALAFLILWEWLRPIPIVTNTGNIQVFVWFAFFSSVLIFIRMRVMYMIPLLFVGSIFGLNYIFTKEFFFSREGGWETFASFVSDLIYNMGLVFTWELGSLTNTFRTFLLFLLLALICYLLYFWIFHSKRIFFFLLATVIYITVLDTFTVVDASMAIIRIVVIGFFMMSLLHVLKIQEEEKVIGRKGAAFISPAWMYTLIFMILIATSVGYAAPKHDPQWGDPVPAFREYVLGQTGAGTGTGNRRVGYGENDEILGGGFQQDHSTVFFAQTEEAFYWRGESKHEYTGAGWTNDPVLRESTSIFEEVVDYYMYRNRVEVENRHVTISMDEGVGFRNIFYPGQLSSLNTDSLVYEVNGQSETDSSLLTFFTDIVGGRISATTNDGNEDVLLRNYDLAFDHPRFNLNDLMADSEDDPESILDIYLQLPDDLPDRVVELAEEIVAGLDNRYDRVVAVEKYFSQNDFEYRTSNVPIPEDGQDYVDQFLFETQYGYCDNYSTAMAVLLRAVDIPTRWVKGFTSGEEVEELADGVKVFEIKNSNAHSWVEVYFPEVGWVPFEPTQGFSNNIDFYEEEGELSESDSEDPYYSEDEEDSQSDVDYLMPPFEEDFDDSGVGAGGTTGGDSESRIATMFTFKYILISITVLLLVVIVYSRQNRLQNSYFLLKYRILGKDEYFTSAYERLLWILRNEGMPRAEGETLREYALRVDRMFNSLSMSQLTKTYESLYYGGRVANGEWEQQRKDWEELVKTINS